LEGHLLLISFMTVAELEQWALTHRWGEPRRRELEELLSRFTVVPSDRDLCRWWAVASVSARRKGRPILVADAWIAATALLFGVPVATHNPADFVGVDGLKVITEVGRR